MSLENVEAFYERLATDPDFNAQIQSVKSNEECSQIVQAAGYNFTQQEFEQYTTLLLDLNSSDVELRNVDEKELAAVYGGFFSEGVNAGKLPSVILPRATPLYGGVYKGPINSPIFVASPLSSKEQDAWDNYQYS